MSRRVKLFVPDDQLGIDHVRRVDSRSHLLGSEPCQAATRAYPDRAVALCSKSIQIAIIPDQAIAAIIVIPSISIPHIHTPVRARPQPFRRVKTEEVNGCRLSFRVVRGVNDLGNGAPHSNLVQASAIAVTYPHIAVLCCRQSEDNLMAQTIGLGKVGPGPAREPKEPVGGANPDITICRLNDRPYLNWRHLLYLAEAQGAEIRDKEPLLGRRPDSVLFIEGEGVGTLRAQSVLFREPFNLAGT
jgi:hypothetical protein